MAIAPYWATAFLKVIVSNVTDVNQIITAFRTAVTITLPLGSQWVESPSGTFTSPADPVSGYTMTLVFTRNAALQLIISCKDQNGVTVMNGGISPVSGLTVPFYVGPTHFWIQVSNDSVTGVNGSYIAAVIADPTPEAKNASTTVVFAKTVLTSAFATTNVFSPDSWLCIDSAGATPNNGGTNGLAGGPVWQVGNGLTLKFITAAGTELAEPVAGNIRTVGNGFTHLRHSGIFPQFAWVDRGHAVGSSVVVPIDIGVTGTFDVVGTPAELQMNNNGSCLLAVRSA